LRDQITLHKIKDRLNDTQEQLDGDVTTTLKTKWNLIDGEKGRYIKAAINKFDKGKHRKPESKPLARSGLRVRY